MIIALLLIAHIVLAIICERDLFTFSHRTKKIIWMIFLAVVPFVSAIVYRITMKRRMGW